MALALIGTAHRLGAQAAGQAEELDHARRLPCIGRAVSLRDTGADALLLATPEYNNGVPDVFRDRPVAVIGASPAASARRWRRANGCRCCARSARASGAAAG
ncbi:MAG TPA: hypothetical protein VNU71_02330 [Burkholderiaceae bacterium]|nr:hypothetical protein [Burkholderiaceae bacterium]